MGNNKFTKLLVAGSLSLSMFSVSVIPTSITGINAAYALSKPAYPQNFKASASQTQVSLSWSKVYGATSYVVERNGVKIYEGASYNVIDKNVKDNTSYTYTLYAKNSAGTSAGVVLKVKTPAIPKPGIPVTFKASTSFTSVNLMWSKASNATSYEVTRNGVKIYSGSALSFVDKNLKTNTAYTYTLIAKNSSGSSSTKSVAVKTLGVPTAPSGLKASSSFQSITLSWNKTDNTTGYELQRNGVKIYEGASTSFVDKALTMNTGYEYTLIAKNQAGVSAQAKLTAKTLGAPNAVTGVSATPSYFSVSLNWKNNANTSTYEVQRNGVKVYEGPNLSFIDKSLKASTSYTYTIIAKNPAGSSAQMNITTKTLGVPSTPTVLKASPSFKSVTVTWDKASGATSYELLKDGVMIYEGINLKFVDNKVNMDTPYIYTIIAKNPAGNSQSFSISTKTLGEPSAVTGLNAVPTAENVTVSWNKSSIASSYELQRNGVKIYEGPNLKFTDTKVNPNTSYTYTVIAKNVAGNSKTTTVSVKTLQMARPAAVTNFRPSASFDKVTLSWSKVSNVDYYVLTRNGITIYKGSDLSFVDKGVKPGTSYRYDIVAVNKGGNSPSVGDFAKTITEKEYLINTIDSSYKGNSIIDYLNSAKQPSSFAARKVLATKLGITGYTGSSSQNLAMLKILRSDGK